MEEAYNSWLKKPSPENMGRLLEAANPVIDSSIKSYAGGNPSLRSKARHLAVGAFRTYDPSKGTKLSTHLMTQLQPLTRSYREYTQVTKIPERVSIDLYRYNQEHQKFMDEIGREPHDSELADRLGISKRRITKIKKFGKGVLSEGSWTSDDNEEGLTFPGVDAVDPHSVWLDFVHHDLPPIDKQILEWKTGYNGQKVLSTNDIAKKLRLTPGAVSQRAKKIAEKLSEGVNVI